MGDERWDVVAEAVASRMAELGLSKKKVSELGGPSGPTLNKVLSGERVVRIDALVRLARVLQWPPTAIDQLLSGADPSDLVDTPPPDWREEVEERLGAIEAVLGALAEREGLDVSRVLPRNRYPDLVIDGHVVEVKSHHAPERELDPAEVADQELVAADRGKASRGGRRARRPEPEPEVEGP